MKMPGGDIHSFPLPYTKCHFTTTSPYRNIAQTPVGRWTSESRGLGAASICAITQMHGYPIIDRWKKNTIDGGIQKERCFH